MAVNWQKEPPVQGIGEAKVVDSGDMQADTRRGGRRPHAAQPEDGADRSPASWASRRSLPGTSISEHWHPFSEEFIYCVRGTLTADLDDEPP